MNTGIDWIRSVEKTQQQEDDLIKSAGSLIYKLCVEGNTPLCYTRHPLLPGVVDVPEYENRELIGAFMDTFKMDTYKSQRLLSSVLSKYDFVENIPFYKKEFNGGWLVVGLIGIAFFIT